MALFSAPAVYADVPIQLPTPIGPVVVADVPRIGKAAREWLVYHDNLGDLDKAGAIAVSPSGFIGQRRHEDDATRWRLALEWCQAAAKEPCSIVIDNGIAYPFEATPVEIKYSGEFELDRVPFVSPETRAKLRKKDFSRGSKRSLAVSPTGAWGYKREGLFSSDDGAAGALENCRKHSSRCVLIAVDGEWVFTEDTEVWALGDSQ